MSCMGSGLQNENMSDECDDLKECFLLIKRPNILLFKPGAYPLCAPQPPLK